MLMLVRAAGAAITALVIAAPAMAQTAKKELTPQQQRMGQCAHEAKGKKGDEYKAYMKQCLSTKKDAAAEAKPAVAKAEATKPAPAKSVTKAAPAAETAAPAAATKTADAGKPAASQKDKMKTCNAQAKEKALKGDERKSFMSTCLKG